MKAKQTRGLVPLLDRAEKLLLAAEVAWLLNQKRPDSDHISIATKPGTPLLMTGGCDPSCPSCKEIKECADFYYKVLAFRDGIKTDIVTRACEAAKKRGKGGGAASAAKAEARYKELLGDMGKLPKPTPKKIAQQLARAGKLVPSESTIRRQMKKKTVSA